MANVYTIPKQNYIEEIVQDFGRFFHSPLYFNTQLPYLGTISFMATSGSGLSIVEENVDYSNGTAISTEADSDSRHFCLQPEVGSILKMYQPYISPAYFIDDGDTYRLVPCVEDSSLLIRVYSSTGGTFDTWNPGSGDHPFTVTRTFYVSFLGKRF